mmetsp:Transcript_48713/g.97192  ORF Transcript_48713/g.97192 Transcript_48713/m.97192 type:complete len:83 (+) Transcript_48713:372-620(+)
MQLTPNHLVRQVAALKRCLELGAPCLHAHCLLSAHCFQGLTAHIITVAVVAVAIASQSVQAGMMASAVGKYSIYDGVIIVCR